MLEKNGFKAHRNIIDPGICVGGNADFIILIVLQGPLKNHEHLAGTLMSQGLTLPYLK